MDGPIVQRHFIIEKMINTRVRIGVSDVGKNVDVLHRQYRQLSVDALRTLSKGAVIVFD